MTEIEIIVGNKLIAKFMGYPFLETNCYCFYGGPINGNTIKIGTVISKTPIDTYESHGDTFLRGTDWEPIKCDLDRWYNFSWNWLMPVVEEINKTHNDNLIRRDLIYTLTYLLSGGYGFTDYKRDWQSMTITNVWLAVVEFIKWYNLKNKA